MTWASFDDGYTDAPVWDGIGYEARWHYHALVSLCCRLGLWDGRVPTARAARASDVPDAAGCVAQLVDAGLLVVDDGMVTLVEIGHHVPPEGQRPENLLPRKRRNQREYRQRQCDAGRHSKDCPRNCPARVTDRVTDRVAERVTGNAGTGRDGTGRDGKDAVKEADENEEREPANCCGEPSLTVWSGANVCRNCGTRSAL